MPEILMMGVGAAVALAAGIVGLVRKRNDDKQKLAQVTVKMADGSVTIFKVTPQEALEVKDEIKHRHQPQRVAAMSG